MGLFEKVRAEFIDIIEWLDPSQDTIAYRFERFQNEIKMGAQLTVRPGQVAILVGEGQVADVYEPGRHRLETQNMPVLTTLMGWKYGFNSPFKAEVYFFNTKVFTNLKWGTANPITIRDPELGPVRLRAYGTYTMRVSDARILLEQLISTDGLFQTDEISDHLRNMIVSAFASWVGQDQTPLFDLAANYQVMGEQVRDAMQPNMQQFGLELRQLLIENISLPPEVEAALDKRASIGILGNMQQYTQYQAANAIEQSAKNPAGASPGLDLGVGIAMGQQIANAMNPRAAAAHSAELTSKPTPPVSPGPAAPPPPMPISSWYITRGGQNFGPYSQEQLLTNGLTAQSNVWKQGMAGWQPAHTVPELQSLLSSVPPPPPGN
ncbi:virion core protein (lumpy skin disease virus)-like protein [Leptolyngbya sp. Heron Island J]|uniref:SPFH domain-containing protein n=1 Tax=Leptolyngbya sp. Heron Island J TaxID=1385935 RepID=UPI0003B99922|nr:SPFH domain-containing protein [Leptolyngbya sp. Heron Island J]ESA35506.1 virion core protein (lumpy skin disease virus)-like protein [Leptolyngbya sp. Heron Island J]